MSCRVNNKRFGVNDNFCSRIEQQKVYFIEYKYKLLLLVYYKSNLHNGNIRH